MELNMIKQMEQFARRDTSVVSLGQGIPAGRAPSTVHEAVISALQNDVIDRYSEPSGLIELRSCIAQRLQSQELDYSADEIIVTSGAIEAINAALLTFVTAMKNEVIVPQPTYSAYTRAVAIAKGIVIPITLDETAGWELCLEDIAASVTAKTAALLLCNPNNPTGSIYSKHVLVQLCELAQRYDFKLIVDEVYGNMLFDSNELYTPAQEVAFRRQVIRVVSFSKDFNLTGWRIGFLHSDSSVVKKILPVHDTLVNCAAVPSQFAAIAALSIADEVYQANRQLYLQNRTVMQLYLESMSQWLDFQTPKGGYFFFPKLINITMSAQEFCFDLLKREKVVCVPGSDFGKTGNDHIRLCFGRSPDDIQLAMQRLQRYFETCHTGDIS